ncbi:MAG: hypothetical protein U0941_29810 [Planctomycetaceae bacterium]
MTDSQDPSASEVSGRDSSGRFTKGNRAGRGNPHAKRVQKLRTALIASVTASDIKAVCSALIQKAKSGDVPSAKLLLDRCLGKTTLPDATEKPTPDSEPSDDAEVTRSPLLDDQQVVDTYHRLVREFEETLLAASRRATERAEQ